MKRKRLTAAIVVLAIALAIVVGAIAVRQAEYAHSAAYYGALRG